VVRAEGVGVPGRSFQQLLDALPPLCGRDRRKLALKLGTVLTAEGIITCIRHTTRGVMPTNVAAWHQSTRQH
jgi:hypothetical protein